MPTADVPIALRESVSTCPRCQSIACRSNLLPNLRLGEALGNAWAEQRRRRTGRALRALASWAFIEAANGMREPWSCDHCRESFR